MSIHAKILKLLATGFALSVPSIASAHHFPPRQTRAEIAAERAAACRAAAAPPKRSYARFNAQDVVRAGTPFEVAKVHRFYGGRHVPDVACRQPAQVHVARR